MNKKLIPILLFLFYFCFPVGAAPAFESVADGVEVTHEIMEYIYNHHLSRPGVDVLTEGAIRGMLETLNDPYTEYLSPDDLSKFISSLDGGFSGIGVELAARDSCPVVTRVLPGSPAAKAGLRAGDQIVKVNAQDMTGRPLSEVVEKIRGPQGSLVKLTIRRPGTGEFGVEIKRAEITGPTCEWRIISDGVGYIYIHTFGTRTAQEFRAALAELQKTGIKGLLLDLRNDPGGYFQAAVEIAGCFLPPGKLVVTTVDRNGNREEYKTAGNQETSGNSSGFNLPLAVLINSYSASAAEVLAGALADHQVATLVGTRSYGKGVVQAIIPLQAGGALKMTIARYFTPRGMAIDQNGLLPDRVVSTPELQMVVARQLITAQRTRQIMFALDGSVVILDGEKISGQLAPLKRENEYYLPLRFSLEAMGYEVQWREATRDIAVQGRGREFILPGADLFVKDGTAYLKAGFFRQSMQVNLYQKGDYLILET